MIAINTSAERAIIRKAMVDVEDKVGGKQHPRWERAYAAFCELYRALEMLDVDPSNQASQ